MGVEITGLDEAQAAFAALEAGWQDLAADAFDPVHDAILTHVRQRRIQIPYDTGALAQSLTDPRDRAHVYERNGDVIRYGSSLIYAASPHVAPRIPLPGADLIARVVDAALDDLLREALG